MNNKIRFFLTFLCTLGFLLLLGSKVELSAVKQQVLRAAPLPLAGALALSFLSNCLLAAVRWRFILKRLGLRMGLGEAFLVKMGSGPIKSLLPLRSGEASRVLYLKRVHGFSAVAGTASILLELGSNLLVFALFILLGGICLDADPASSRLPIVLVLGGTLSFLLLVCLPPARRTLRRLAERLPAPRLRGAVLTLFSLRRFFLPLQLLALLGYSLAISSGKLLGFFLVARALGVSYSAETYLVALPFSILLATIPVTILGIGLRENSLAQLVPLYNSVPEAAVIGSALLLTATEYVFPALLGLFWTRRFLAGLLSGRAEAEDAVDGSGNGSA